VKFVEGSGARVAPVHFDSSPEELQRAFQSINGLLLPGGPDLIFGTAYYNASAYLLSLAVEATRRYQAR
jgi:peptidoglycan hydrolase-like protein with peptidoglycan-binding domain